MAITITADLRVDDEDEALDLMLHHLRLAAAYFEACPTNVFIPRADFSHTAMMAWATAMEALYPEEED